jgi:hypothetical protein
MEMTVEAEIPDLAGESYTAVLRTLHETLEPNTYFEIGTAAGGTLVLAKCAAIAVDSQFKFNNIKVVKQIIAKPSLGLYQMSSDAFFARHSPTTLFGAPIDFAFLDGLHRCEYLLRDFVNTERHCKRNSVIALHDCLPVEAAITSRLEEYFVSTHPARKGWWAGDVWRTALLLKRRRSDLAITTLDSAPTGLVLVTNLNPDNAAFSDTYTSHVQEMISWDIRDMGIANYFKEMEVESTNALASHEQITARFWL